MEHKNTSGGGFFMGLVVGAAVGALVSTKKGRQILKELVDYGIEYAEGVVDMEGVEKVFRDEEETMSGEMEDNFPVENSSSEKEEKPKKKRLFRGLKKK